MADPIVLSMQDADFRKSMRAKQAVDPASQDYTAENFQADKWVQLDDKTTTLEKEIKGHERAKERGPGTIWDAENAMSDARLDRDEHRMNRGGAQDQKQWEEGYQNLDQDVGERQKAFGEALKNSTPEELEKLQAHIDGKRDALMKTIEERQGIAKLPSEQAAEDQQNQDQQSQDQGDQVQRGLGDRIKQRREEQEQEQGQDQGAGNAQPRASGQLRPNYGAYATTIEEEEIRKQQEEDRLGAWREHGRAPTHDEVVKFETDRVAAEDQQQGKQQQAAATTQQAHGAGQEAQPAQAQAPTAMQETQQSQVQAEQEPVAQQETQQDAQQEDLHAQGVQATSTGFGDRLAAKRQEQAQGQQQDDTQQQAPEQTPGTQAEAAPQQDIWQQSRGTRVEADQQDQTQQGQDAGQQAEVEQVQATVAQQDDQAQAVNTQQADGGQDEPAPRKVEEEEQGASTVASRRAKQMEQAEAQSEAKAEQAGTQTQTREWGEDHGQGM